MDDKARIRELEVRLASAENELANLRQLTDAPENIMFYSLDSGYRYITFNEAHRQFIRHNWDVDISPGMRVFDVLPSGEERASAKLHFDRALAGETYILKRPYRRDKAGTRFYENTYIPLTVSGEIRGLAVFAHDITEWSEKEQEGRKYRSFFEKALEGIFRSTRHGRFIEANQEMARILGYDSPDDLIGSVRDISSQLYCNPDDRERVFEVLRHKGVVKDFETRMFRKDGSRIWVEFNCRVERDDDGRTLFLEGKLTDISHRKEAEKRAEMRRQQVIQADKMASLGVLVAGVAHEINNPASHLSLNLPLLKDVWLDALNVMDEFAEDHGDFVLGGLEYSDVREQLPYLLQEMMDATARINGMVSRLKDYSRHAPEDLLEPVCLSAVVEGALVFARHRLESCGCRFDVQERETEIVVEGDAQRLIQVLLNLVLNSCDALPKSGGVISLRTGVDAEGPFIEVADNGCGIDPGDIRHVQDPFFTTKRTCGGTGLGLSISASIMQDHGGRLDFESAAGKGTRATMRFLRKE